MTAAFGSELAPGSPEHQWIQLVIAAVEKHTGTRSRWNGKLYLEPDPENLGTAHHDGSMTISAKLFERLESAYLGRPQSAEDLYWLRDAVVTAIHEAKHLSSELGDPSVPGAALIGDDDVRALEEGRAEQWAHEHANDVIREIGMNKYVPGVIGPPSVDAYRAYSGAEAQLAHGLAQIADVRPEEIRRLVDTTERTQRWNRLADLIIDQRLANNRLMPPEHRESIRQGIVDTLRAHYTPLRAVQLDQNTDDASKFQQGIVIGRNAVIAVAHLVDHAEAHYRAFYAQQAAAARVQPVQEQSTGSQPFWEQGARGQALKAEEEQIGHYQKFLSGQPPAGRHAATGAGSTSNQHNQRTTSRDHQPER